MDIPKELQGKAISLEHLCLSEIAWQKEDALKLIDHFEENDIFILGGDVLAKESDGYRHNYDNWYLNKDQGDAKKSVLHARSYINSYPDGDYAFVFVIE